VSACFITATGTEIGKTYVTTMLVREMRAKGLNVRALKPVLSGYEPEEAAICDSGLILQALGQPVSDAAIQKITPWRFAAPLSPDMAAAREGRAIDFDGLLEFCTQGTEEFLVVEGVGGAMVPLTESETVLDWIIALGYPAFIVAGSYLGTISHTLTTVSAMRSRGATVAGIVISESETSPVPVSETIETISRFLPDTSVVAVPRGGIVALAPLLGR
jgi:dethiobiotin synthetase